MDKVDATEIGVANALSAGLPQTSLARYLGSKAASVSSSSRKARPVSSDTRTVTSPSSKLRPAAFPPLAATALDRRTSAPRRDKTSSSVPRTSRMGANPGAKLEHRCSWPAAPAAPKTASRPAHDASKCGADAEADTDSEAGDLASSAARCADAAATSSTPREREPFPPPLRSTRGQTLPEHVLGAANRSRRRRPP